MFWRGEIRAPDGPPVRALTTTSQPPARRLEPIKFLKSVASRVDS